MAILGRDGQLIANASQRTLVLETKEQLQAFQDNLPEGVNLKEAFDIYVRESGEVYAAGVPFKLRETTEKGLDLHISNNGTGDGATAESPMAYDQLPARLASLAANYDFNSIGMTLFFAPGLYSPLQISGNFLNCPIVEITPEEGYDELKVVGVPNSGVRRGYQFDTTQCVCFESDGLVPAIECDSDNLIFIQNVGVSTGAYGIHALRGSMELLRCGFELRKENIEASSATSLVHAQDAKITVLETYGMINNGFGGNLPVTMFLASQRGEIVFGGSTTTFRKLTAIDSPYDGKNAIFMASDLGSINLSGVLPQEEITTAIDESGYEEWENLTQSGWCVGKRSGMIYLPATLPFTVLSMLNCDNTSSIIKEGEK